MNLRADLIHPGDVLLSFGGGKISELIVQLSGPKELRDIANGYSHAALCLNDLLTYESDGGVIGTRPIYPHVNNLFTMERYALPPGNAPRFQLFRHPKMPVLDAVVSSEEFRSARERLMDDTFGGDYSKMARLVALADVGPVRKRIFTLFAEVNDAKTAMNVHNAFCSEVVAKFFDFYGLPLFRDGRSPAKASPNDLADSSQSYLEVVPDAVVAGPPPIDKYNVLVDRTTDPIWTSYPPGVDDSSQNQARAMRLTARELEIAQKKVVRLAVGSLLPGITLEEESETVVLYGEVESHSEKERIENLVRQLAEGITVVSRITVKGG